MKKADKQWIAAKAFIVKDGKVLVLREAETSVSSVVGYYQIPGGRVELGEPFMDGLLREAKEETGLDVKPIRPLTIAEWSPTVKGEVWQIVAMYYICEPLSDEVELSFEHDDFKWIDPAKYKDENVVPDEPGVYEAYLEQMKD